MTLIILPANCQLVPNILAQVSIYLLGGGKLRHDISDPGEGMVTKLFKRAAERNEKEVAEKYHLSLSDLSPCIVLGHAKPKLQDLPSLSLYDSDKGKGKSHI